MPLTAVHIQDAGIQEQQVILRDWEIPRAAVAMGLVSAARPVTALPSTTSTGSIPLRLSQQPLAARELAAAEAAVLRAGWIGEDTAPAGAITRALVTEHALDCLCRCYVRPARHLGSRRPRVAGDASIGSQLGMIATRVVGWQIQRKARIGTAGSGGCSNLGAITSADLPCLMQEPPIAPYAAPGPSRGMKGPTRIVWPASCARVARDRLRLCSRGDPFTAAGTTGGPQDGSSAVDRAWMGGGLGRRGAVRFPVGRSVALAADGEGCGTIVVVDAWIDGRAIASSDGSTRVALQLPRSIKTTGSMGQSMVESVHVAFSVAKRVVLGAACGAIGVVRGTAGTAQDTASLGDDPTSKTMDAHCTPTDRSCPVLHVHLWRGGQKKDGPSAGIAFLIAIMSAMSGIAPIPHCCTGEVTLSGDILAVGDIRSKVHAGVAALAPSRDVLAGLRGGLQPEAGGKPANRTGVVVVPMANRSTVASLPDVERGAGAVKIVGAGSVNVALACVGLGGVLGKERARL